MRLSGATWDRRTSFALTRRQFLLAVPTPGALHRAIVFRPVGAGVPPLRAYLRTFPGEER